MPDEPTSKANVALGPGGEFDLVRAMLRVWGDVAQGVGDDAAVLEVGAPEKIVISADTSIENVHFREAWLTAREIGYRAATTALSDLAAMAARPLGILLAITLPERWRERLEELARGVGDAARDAATHVLGGDVSRGLELSLTVTVVGATAAPLFRRGARAGDRVYVTGLLGGPADAVASLEHGLEPGAWSRQRFAGPVARIREARWLATKGARALIDISDGLASELEHLAAASNAEFHINLDCVPIAPGLDATAAFSGGEEYELLAIAPSVIDAGAFAREFGLPLTDIGVVVGEDRAAVVVSRGGVRVDLARGHDHFSL